MFTGIIEDVGTVISTARVGTGKRVAISTHLANESGIQTGDSVSVDGCCLTAARVDARGFDADLSAETLSRTTLGALAVTSKVNLERAVPAGGRLGGHIVQGHVDAPGAVQQIAADGDMRVVTFTCDPLLKPFLVEKGSIAINGVSLTVNRITDDGFVVTLVPFTLLKTTLHALQRASPVNLEVDVVAKYVLRGVETLLGKKIPGFDLTKEHGLG